jgi:hypothetical protein
MRLAAATVTDSTVSVFTGIAMPQVDYEDFS